MIRPHVASALLFTSLASAALSGCGRPSRPPRTSQPVEQVSRLRPGMTQAEVVAILGEPVRTEHSWSTEAWHYCRTGDAAHALAVIVFNDGRVAQARNYTVPVADARGSSGDCQKYIQSVSQSVGARPGR